MKTVKLLLFFVLFTCIYISYCSNPLLETLDNKESNSSDKLLNIYGEPLKPCRTQGSSDKNGSWNSNGYCDETGGGVHQICVEVDKTPDFSHHTGQGRWTDDRAGKNHCMCLGAWALYKARQERGEIPETNNELQCESIMDDALDSTYVEKWSKWNGHELPQQIIHGVNTLYTQCYNKGNKSQRENLNKIYKNLTNELKEDNIEFDDISTYK